MIYCEAEYCTHNIDGECGLGTVHIGTAWDDVAVCDEYEDYREVEDED